jgi:hypothetical protein
LFFLFRFHCMCRNLISSLSNFESDEKRNSVYLYSNRYEIYMLLLQTFLTWLVELFISLLKISFPLDRIERFCRFNTSGSLSLSWWNYILAHSKTCRKIAKICATLNYFGWHNIHILFYDWTFTQQSIKFEFAIVTSDDNYLLCSAMQTFLIHF